jgi:hypothetical protein
MNIWDPFHPFVYFVHTILGGVGLLGALIALSVTKGSSRHVLAGRAFAVAASVVAATAISFSITSFAPMAMASATITLSAIGSALLAIREKSQKVATGELATTILMAAVVLWLLYGGVLSYSQGGLLWIPPLAFGAIAAALFVNDIRFMKYDSDVRENKRLTRHLSRMSFAFAIAVHEPIVIFADRLSIHPALAFYGPFIVWPLLFVFFNNRINKKMIVIPDR